MAPGVIPTARRRRAQLLAPLVLAALAGAALGQEEGLKADPADGAVRVAQPLPAVQAWEITGRTFGGVPWPLPVTEGPLKFAAQRVSAWSEAETVSGAPASARRLFLDGDARLSIGPYSFTARRAAVWLSPVPGQADVWQVFALLDQPNMGEGVAPVTMSGGELPVRGMIRATKGIELSADRLEPTRPANEFVTKAERVLADRLRKLVAPAPAPVPEAAPEDVPPELINRGTPEIDDEQRREAAEFAARLAPAGAEEPLFATDGIISFSGGEITAVKDEGAPAVLLSGGVTISYWDKKHDKTLQVAGERAVIFLNAQGSDPQAAAAQKSAASGKVRGFYLEGDVTFTDGEHTGRAPRVYYSVGDNRAIMVDAVFWMYDQRRQLPLYVRAKTIEQLSSEQFRATGAKLSNTAFFEPDLSIGASTVTITRTPAAEPGPQGVLVDARDITLRAGGVPFFWWPVMKGDPSSIPLRDLRIENSSGSGSALKTTWNAYSLLGIQPKKDESADIFLDEYFGRGPAFGGALRWGEKSYDKDQPDPSKGGAFGYILPEDRGTDVLPTGQKVDRHGEVRGMALLEHRADLGGGWSVFAEGSYISDPDFVASFFEPLARNRREFTNSLYLRNVEDNALFSGEVRAREGDFIPNEYLLQSPGYSVAKYPDLGYWRLADDLLDAYPGLLTYSSSYRFTEMRMQFVDPAVKDFGFNAPFRSQSAFGVQPGQSLAAALRAQGLTQEPVARFDTRHELSMQLSVGPLNVTPFLVGRFTGYDDNFDAYSGKTDSSRVWGAEGLTLSTEVSKVDNSVESRLLDLHRIRHIVQPSVTVWHADTTVDRGNLPVFDDEVESLAEGTAVRFGIDQTWQTQRGGPGRWRSVDVLRLNAGLVVSSGDVDKESPIGRWVEYEPELSNLGGSFATLEGAWQATEVLGIGGETVYDIQIGQQAKTAVGFTLQHDINFSTYAELRYLNSQNQSYAIVGANYQLTPKYSFGMSGSYDTVRNEFQSVNVDVRRRLPNVVIGVSLGENTITGVTSFGFVFQPVGINQQGAAIRGVGGPAGSGGFGL